MCFCVHPTTNKTLGRVPSYRKNIHRRARNSVIGKLGKAARRTPKTPYTDDTMNCSECVYSWKKRVTRMLHLIQLHERKNGTYKYARTEKWTHALTVWQTDKHWRHGCLCTVLTTRLCCVSVYDLEKYICVCVCVCISLWRLTMLIETDKSHR